MILLWLGICLPAIGAWGPTGHRVIGHIAEQYLSKRAARQIGKIMDGESLARASTWMDEIKSDRSMRHMSPWHYINIPEGGSYDSMEKPEGGDVIEKIEQFTAELKAGGLSREEQVFRIRCLVHLVGDLHQPMHTGRKEDLGGNRIKILWFGNETNLHRLWDSDMIDYQKLSYTELANFINHPEDGKLKEWQGTGPREWAVESSAISKTLYESVKEGENYGYKYVFDFFGIAENRMLMSGIRLAGILNDIYG